jgi:mitofusin
MAQAYYSNTGKTASPLPSKESSFEGLNGSDKLFKVEDVQEAYIEHKDRCAG